MMTQFFVFLLLCISTLGCSHGQPRKTPATISAASSLEIRATIENPSTASAERPRSVVVRVILTNTSDRPLAVCRCFGIRRTWLFFEIRELPDGGIPDRGPEYDLFSPPPYRCLPPGESISITKDLFHWYAEFGDLVLREWGPDRFHLEPGDYKLRVGYYDDGQPRLRRCSTPSGTVVSEWIPFSVPEPKDLIP